jgi:hypothetical protein
VSPGRAVDAVTVNARAPLLSRLPISNAAERPTRVNGI